MLIGQFPNRGVLFEIALCMRLVVEIIASICEMMFRDHVPFSSFLSSLELQALDSFIFHDCSGVKGTSQYRT
jgi:hypothetical protein